MSCDIKVEFYLNHFHDEGTDFVCSIYFHYSSLYGPPLQALLQATYAMGNTMGPAIGGGLQEVS